MRPSIRRCALIFSCGRSSAHSFSSCSWPSRVTPRLLMCQPATVAYRGGFSLRCRSRSPARLSRPCRRTAEVDGEGGPPARLARHQRSARDSERRDSRRYRDPDRSALIDDRRQRGAARDSLVGNSKTRSNDSRSSRCAARSYTSEQVLEVTPEAVRRGWPIWRRALARLLSWLRTWRSRFKRSPSLTTSRRGGHELPSG